MSPQQQECPADRRRFPSVTGGIGGAAHVVVGSRALDPTTSVLLRTLVLGALVRIRVKAWRLRARRRSATSARPGLGRASWAVVVHWHKVPAAREESSDDHDRPHSRLRA